MNADGQRLTGLLLALLMALLIGGIIGWIIKPCPCESTPLAATVKIDTVTKVIEHEPILVQAAAKIRYIRDTVRQTQTDTILSPAADSRAFVATLDTIINRDTFGLRYASFENEFTLLLRQAPDSLRFETRTITLTNYEKREWWIDALTHLGIGALGYAIGSVR